MKKKIKQKEKGFTLIELLAVIVVLAILALIAVPIVLNIIKDARNNSNKRSIESYARAIDYAVSEHMSENPDQEIVTWEEIKDKVEYKGKVECQWGENLSSISKTGEITLHGCKVNNKTNSIYGYVDGKVVEENGKYKKYSVGDKITYKGMKFYVIAPSDTSQDYVILLKAEPLTYDEVNTLKQSTELKNDIDNSNGYAGISYSATETCGYMNGSWGDSNCSNDYDSSSIKQILQVWSQSFINDLKEVDGYKARLITYDELVPDLYKKIEEEEVPGVILTYYVAKYGWLYNDYYWYWTMSPDNDFTSDVWGVNFNGYLTTGNVSDYNGVVRPVINLKKAAI